MLWVGATWSLVLQDYGGAGGVGGGRGGRLWQSARGAPVSDEDCVAALRLQKPRFQVPAVSGDSFLLQGSGGTDKCESAHLPGVSDVLGSRSAG